MGSKGHLTANCTAIYSAGDTASCTAVQCRLQFDYNAGFTSDYTANYTSRSTASQTVGKSFMPTSRWEEATGVSEDLEFGSFWSQGR
jgi:hypothetical protein